MFEGTTTCFVEFAVISISANYRMSFVAFFFSANSHATNFFEMSVFAMISKTAIASVIMITMKLSKPQPKPQYNSIQP